MFSLGSHRDNRYLYLSMEFLPGGELFSYFRRAGRFKRSLVRFYACEIILALEYLHGLSIVYRWVQSIELINGFNFSISRDLKLENLVLDKAGHLKLTDFGFAKYVQDR